jgi:hypothetical protein
MTPSAGGIGIDIDQDQGMAAASDRLSLNPILCGAEPDASATLCPVVS